MISFSPSGSHPCLSGVPDGAEALALRDFFYSAEQGLSPPHSKGAILYIAPGAEKAAQVTKNLRCLLPNHRIYHLPPWDCLPYDRVSPSQDILIQRVSILTDLLSLADTTETETEALIVVTCAAGFSQRLPPLSAIHNKTVRLVKGQTLVHADLMAYFVSAGYQRVETVREAGEFAVRGGLVDCFPAAAPNPVRLDFFGDILESLRSFDALSQKSSSPLSEIFLYPVRDIILTPQTIGTFRSRFREKFGTPSSLLYDSISQGRSYPGMDHWLPLFYEKTALITDYLPAPLTCVVESQTHEALKSHLQQVADYYQARLHRIPGDPSPLYHPLHPTDVYLMGADLDDWTKANICHSLTSFSPPAHTQDEAAPLISKFTRNEDSSFVAARQQGTVFEALKDRLNHLTRAGKTVIIACATAGSQDRLFTLCQEHDITGHLCSEWPKSLQASPSPLFLIYATQNGFSTASFVVITEQDLFGNTLSRPLKKRRKADEFFSQASQLSHGDLVVHQDHGIGRYEGLQVIALDHTVHDCLTLIYDGNDKLLLPVENIELISRYGSDNSAAQLDRLGAASWQLRKAKVKKRILAIADYLMKIAAERLLHRGETIIYPEQTYHDFCARFPYGETDDQRQAIDDVLADLASGHPMDRLVCGDVGFGKTEVALRAAFAVAAAGKQVAVIVPTTLLCRQHTATFQARFQGFPFAVAQLSRFVSAKEAELTRQGLESGNIKIVISTHGIFSDKIKFNDLGLIIVDEEQHFGVKQKEKLKQFKKDVHVLTLTATPIPRTLQLALTGVREMSLITTPPIDRLAVRTFVMPYDGMTIRESILREYYRGGQIFYVSPRLDDLPLLHEQIATLVPEIKIGIAHGKLSAGQLEQVMIDFYDRRFQLLLSTNIVESGIDVSTANTLILHRSDLFGLSQLYQLRGRIGRSKTQGYAYLTVDPLKPLTQNSQRRLDIMQTLDTLGAGFTLASHDMDIRGTGNIVGEEQSGHIREVGVELYQQLLQDAILTLRLSQGEEKALPLSEETDPWTPQLNLGVSVMIPESYVSDLSVRLGLYRRVSTLTTPQEINHFAAELVDRFGPLPEEAKNLFVIIEIKALCRKAGIEKLDAGPSGVVMAFREEKTKERNLDAILHYVIAPQTRAKVRPDQKIVFLREWSSLDHRLKATKTICHNLAKLAVSKKT